MIKINKPTEIPQKLQTKGKEETDTLKAKFLNKDFNFEFNNKIYGHKSIREPLKKAQNDKCCYCESKLKPVLTGDIEHFRPKAAYKQDENERLHTPGYYWLAYEWDNLLLCCQICNQTSKRNFFPLSNPNNRAKSHLDDINNEEPLLINPAKEDPEEFILFRKEIAYPINNNLKGQVSINILKLNSDNLIESRLEHYKMVNTLFSMIRNFPDTQDATDAKKILKQFLEPSGKYLSMIKSAMKLNFEGKF